MSFDRRQIRSLLAAVADARDDEIDCDACLAGMAEFAETRLLGVELGEALRRIDDHIRLCPECAEEYEVLREALERSAAEGR